MKPGNPHIIVHYHLRHGGVTRVIEATSRALTRAKIPHLILCGAIPPERASLPVCHIPGLDYSTAGDDSIESKLVQAVRERFGASECVWHFHNPCLGKNASLTKAVASLARQGSALILQHHDFAEDGRPLEYSQIASLPLLYPAAARIAQVCINSRDQAAMLAAGLSPGQSHVMPNPITVEPIKRGTPLWIFQPSRGIRRKNLGETLLLACHAPPQARFAVSRRPDQSNWLAIHDHWAALADELRLPVEFNVTDRIAPTEGAETTFTSWLQHASHFLSTSVSEGFGLPFLEAAALGIPVIGRRLSKLDAELGDLPLDHLYSRLLIPNELIDLERLKAEKCMALDRCYRAYGRAVPEFHHPDEDYTDFGHLPESLQEEVIRKSNTHPSLILAETSAGISPLANHLTQTLEEMRVPSVSLDRYHADNVAAHLLQIRELVLQAPIQPPEDLDRAAMIDHFLSPTRFQFLCQ